MSTNLKIKDQKYFNIIFIDESKNDFMKNKSDEHIQYVY